MIDTHHLFLNKTALSDKSLFQQTFIALQRFRKKTPLNSLTIVRCEEEYIY